MARGKEKTTIGTKVESKVQSLIRYSGLGVGGASGLSLMGEIGAEPITSPEGAAGFAGFFLALATGTFGGIELARRTNGKLSDTVDNLCPSRFQDGELYLDKRDPFELGIDRRQLNRLDDERLEQVRRLGIQGLYSMEQEQDDVDNWFHELIYGEINGFQSEFKTNDNYVGYFKTGYVDREHEVFVQAPTKGDTFDEAMKRVKTWKENAETLDKADQYIDQILEKGGTETGTKGYVGEDVEVKIDYEFLRKNEETLREEVEGGIATPSENYDIVATSHNGEPIPVLVGEFNQKMVEDGGDLCDSKKDEVQKRKKVLGMYMDAMMQEGKFEGVLADYWFSMGNGRQKTKNMFYDPETDTVGVTDIGELGDLTGRGPEEMPEISLEARYA